MITMEKQSLMEERKRIDARLAEILKEETQNAKHKDVDIDGMTPDLWRTMSRDERQAWWNWQRTQGFVSFRCILCGFPTAQGVAGCIACKPELYAEMPALKIEPVATATLKEIKAWRSMNQDERKAWVNQQRMQGNVSCDCPVCGCTTIKGLAYHVVPDDPTPIQSGS